MLIAASSCDQTNTGPSDTETKNETAVSTAAKTEITTEYTALETEESSSNNTINMSLEEICSDLSKHCDEQVRIFSRELSFRDNESTEKNLSAGIKDYIEFEYLGPYEIEENNYLAISYSIFVLEFDTDSDNYKNLKQGDMIELVIRNEKKKMPIASINGQYALIIVAYLFDENEFTEEYLPDYTIGNIQEIYNVFNEYK